MTQFEALIKGVYPIWGNDTSTYQGYINSDTFMAVQKPRFLIVRISCGSFIDDQGITTLKNFYGQCDLHAYSAFIPGVNPLTQIKTVLNAWDQAKYYINGRLWLDIEKDGLQTVMGAALGGTAEYGKLDDRVHHSVGIYTNPNYFNIYRMAIDTRLNWRQYWIANYTEEKLQTYPNLPAGLKEAVFWQYASTLNGREAGAQSAHLDGDVCLLPENRYAETLTSGEVPEPEPQLKYLQTTYSRVNLRNEPRIATATDVATTDYLGAKLPIIKKTEDGLWYQVGLYIHKTCVKEV